jgi:hypothetical protein
MTLDRPQYWDLLNDTDQQLYLKISAALSAPSSRNKKGKRIADFREILEALVLFECSEEEERWARCLVCGVCLIPPGIAVNTTQLRHLVLKCKSSINGSLKALGFDKIITKHWAYEWLMERIPYLRGKPTDLKQWTIRVCSHVVPFGITWNFAKVSPFAEESATTTTTFPELNFDEESADDIADFMSDCELPP